MNQMTRRQFDDACALLAPLLQPRCNGRLAKLYKADGTMEEALREVVFDSIATDSAVSDVAELAAMTGSVFSKQYRSHLVECANKFDRFTGVDERHVSTLMFRCAGLAYWLGKIVHGMAMTAVEVAKGRADEDEAGSDGEDRKAQAGKPKTTIPCVIGDIHLQGTTVKGAWYRNSALRKLEEDAVHTVETQPKWDPQHDTALPVYYSTVFPFAGNGFSQSDIRYAMQLANFDALPQAVSGQARENKLVPATLPVVWTAYSPLRQFLWALFHEAIASVKLGTSIEKRWECRRLMPVDKHFHTGTVLFKFNVSDTLTKSPHVYTVPHTCAGHWMAFKTAHRTLLDRDSHNKSATPLALWQRYLPMQQQCPQPCRSPTPLAGWPQALHMVDHDEYLVGKQGYQTAWHGAGIDKLNAAHKKMMCISLELEPDHKTDTVRERERAAREKRAIAEARIQRKRERREEAKEIKRKQKEHKLEKRAVPFDEIAHRIFSKLYVVL